MDKSISTILDEVANTIQPSKIDDIAASLKNDFITVQSLVNIMRENQYVREIYQLLIRLDNPEIVSDLENLLDNQTDLVCYYAALSLADMGSAPKSLRLREKLKNFLDQIPMPFQNEKDALESMKIIKRLVVIEPVDINVCTNLQNILFFIPKGAYREIWWPRTWIEACRLLDKLGCLEKLEEVSKSDMPHYLSAAGAIVLVKNGHMSNEVTSWLKNSRDYYLLNSNEKEELNIHLQRLNDADKEMKILSDLLAKQ